jgi:hypothetical protein
MCFFQGIKFFQVFSIPISKNARYSIVGKGKRAAMMPTLSQRGLKMMEFPKKKK